MISSFKHNALQIILCLPSLHSDLCVVYIGAHFSTSETTEECSSFLIRYFLLIREVLQQFSVRIQKIGLEIL
jgi:hypothetical protein